MSHFSKIFSIMLCVVIIFNCASIAGAVDANPSLKLDQMEIEIIKGKSAKINPEVVGLPDGVKEGKYTWETSDKKVAVCQNGNIKGINAGTVVITCKNVLSDGTELTGICTANVVVPVKNLMMKKKTVNVTARDRFKPDITIKPDDATNTILKYEVVDPSIVSVEEDGSLKALKEGKTKVKATSTDGSEKTVEFSVSVAKLIGGVDEEITFQDIPWGSSLSQTKDELRKKGLLRTSVDPFIGRNVFFWPENDYDIGREVLLGQIDPKYKDYLPPTSFVSNLLADTKIGGHDVNQATFYYELDYDDTDPRITASPKALIGVVIKYKDYYEGDKSISRFEIFMDLLSVLEEKYGTAKMYVCKNLKGSPLFQKNAYKTIKQKYKNATEFDGHEGDVGAIAIIKGINDTALALAINYDTVKLFYTKTDTRQFVMDYYRYQDELKNSDNKVDLGV